MVHSVRGFSPPFL